MKCECVQAKNTAIDLASCFIANGYSAKTALELSRCLNVENSEDIQTVFNLVDTAINAALWKRICTMIDRGEIMIISV